MAIKNMDYEIFVRCAKLILAGKYEFKTKSKNSESKITSRTAHILFNADELKLSKDDVFKINKDHSDLMIHITNESKRYIAIRVSSYSYDSSDPFATFLHLRNHKSYNNAKKISDLNSYDSHASKQISFDMINHLVYSHTEFNSFNEISSAKEVCDAFDKRLPF